MIALAARVTPQVRCWVLRAAAAALVVWVLQLWIPPLRNVWLTASEGGWIERSGHLVTLDMLLHTVSLALAVIVIFRRVLTGVHVLLALAAAGLSIAGGDIFVQRVHPFFMAHGLYPEWLGRGAQSGQSAQYAKIWTGTLLLAWLGVMLLFKRWRSFDRIYVWIIGASVLVTTVLFHFTIREAIFESRLHERRVIAVALEAPQEWIFRALCKDQFLDCFETKLGQPYPVTGDAHVDRAIPDQIAGTQASVGRTWSMAGSFPMPGGKPNNDFHVVFHWVDDQTYRIAIDRVQWHRTLQKFQLIYSWIGLPAHLLWLAGGLWLMFWHKARWRRKAGLSAQAR